MARRSPRAVRAQSHPPLQHPVEGLSSHANAEIARIQGEHPELEVRRALAAYRRSVRPGGRWIRFQPDHYGLEDDIYDQRQILERTLFLLSSPTRRELWKLVAPLDEEFLRRTLPDYRADPGQPWWSRRLSDR